MGKKEELEELFQKWKEKQRKGLDKSFVEGVQKEWFIKDGIFDEEIFDSQNPKALFIGIEANVTDNIKGKEFSEISSYNNFLTQERDDGNKGWWPLQKGVSIYYSWIRSWCLGGREEDKEILKDDIAKNYAYMNLNKRGGNSQANYSVLGAYCREYSEMIEKEITIINPDVIIWLGYQSFSVIKMIMGKPATDEVNDKSFWFESEAEMEFYKSQKTGKKIPILKAYHPSRGNTYKPKNKEKLKKQFETFRKLFERSKNVEE